MDEYFNVIPYLSKMKKTTFRDTTLKCVATNLYDYLYVFINVYEVTCTIFSEGYIVHLCVMEEVDPKSRNMDKQSS